MASFESEPLVGSRLPVSTNASDDDMLASDHDAIDTEDSFMDEHREEQEMETPKQKAKVTPPVLLFALVFLAAVSFFGGYLSAYKSRKVDCKLRDFQAWPVAWNADAGRVNVTIFAAILSAAKNYEQRMALRQTWLQNEYVGIAPFVKESDEVQFAYRFFVGHNDAVDYAELQREAALYNDLEILPYEDNYHTLPEKRIRAIKWAVDKSNLRFAYFCRMDDDLYMNIDDLVERYQTDKPSIRVYSGAAWYAGLPHRRGKWAISRSVYFPQEWPPYVEGAISLMSVDLIYYVYTNMEWLQPVGHLEDVSMAIWMLALQVHPQNEPGIVSGNSLHKYGKQNVCTEDLLAMPELTIEEIRAMYLAGQASKSICKVLPRREGPPPRRGKKPAPAPVPGPAPPRMPGVGDMESPLKGVADKQDIKEDTRPMVEVVEGEAMVPDAEVVDDDVIEIDEASLEEKVYDAKGSHPEEDEL